MGLSYFYEFQEPAKTTAAELETFLKEVQLYAESVGFDPTMVLNVPFDTPERREFAHRLSASLWVQDERLKAGAIPDPEQVRNHDPTSGECRLIPERGVVLVVTDEKGCETTFGFLRYPSRISDQRGNVLAETDHGDAWVFRDFVDSPDPRFRRVVQMFDKAGYLRSESDEFKSSPAG
jgi:hypothetical protein